MKKKEHFEVLLEDIKGDVKLALEVVTANTEQLKRMDGRFDAVEQRLEKLEVSAAVTNQRLERLEAGAAVTNQRLERLEAGAAVTNQRLDKLEQGQQEIKSELRQMNQKLGVLHQTVEDHEIRIRQLEIKG